MMAFLHRNLARFTILLFLASTLSVFAPSLFHDFIYNWDDDEYVTENMTVRGLTGDHVRTAFTSTYVGNYAPLQIVTYMVDHSVWGMKPAGFILTNIILHALNGYLLFRLILRLHERAVMAAIAAFLFLFHPVQIESVIWISQRKSVLSLFFFLAALNLYLAYRHSVATRAQLYCGSLAAFSLALISKSVTVILPAVLVCHDFLFPDREVKPRLRDKIPFCVAALVAGIIGMVTQDRGHGGGRTPYPGGSPYATLCTMLPVFCRYLGMLFWPNELSVVYSPPVHAGLDGTVLAAGALLLLPAVLGWWLWHRKSPLFFWFSLFVLGFLPVSQVVPLITLMNDRYLYFPMIGAATLAAWVPSQVVAQRGIRWRLGSWALLAVLGTTLVIKTVQRQAVWQDEVTLWQDAVLKVPGNVTARNNLSGALLERGDRAWDRGDFEQARQYYERVLAVDPGDQIALHNIGSLHLRRGEFSIALPYLLTLTNLYPWYENGFLRLGTTCLNLGRQDQAVAAFRRALEINPQSQEARQALAATQSRQPTAQ